MALTDQQQAPAPTYGTYGLSGEQITNFINQNLGNAQAIADAAQQFGISAADIEAAAGYTPQQQATYFSSAGVSEPGIAGLTPVTYGGDAGLTIKDVRDLVSANIQDPGVIARGMQQTGITQQDLESIFQGIYTPGQITNYLAQPAAKLYATEYNEGASPLTAKESFDYIIANLGDPTRVSQAAKSRGYTAQDLLDIGNIYAPEQKLTLEGLNQYLATGQEGFQSAYGNIAQDIFGSPEEIEQIADLTYQAYQRQIQNNQNLTPAQKQKLLSESRDDYIGRVYGPESYASSSLEDIEESLRGSEANRYQEALRLRSIALNTLGYEMEDANALVAKAMIGQGLTKEEQKIFDTLLKDQNVSKKDYNDLMTYAAITNPNAPIFQKDPDLLTFYTPIGEARSAPTMLNSYGQDTGRGRSGQYGIYENMPLLNANIALQIAGTHGKVDNPQGALGDVLFHQLIPQLGIDFNSWTESTNFRAGNSVVGVNFDKQYINDVANFEKALNSGQIREISDEGGTNYYRVVPNPNYRGGEGESEFNYELTSKPTAKAQGDTLAGKYQVSYSDAPTSVKGIQDSLTKAAKALGISTEGKDLNTLFDEVSSGSEGLFQITGSAINAGMADDNGKYTNTMTLKESRDELNPENKNHFNAVYRQMGDKLVPVDVKFFNFEPPKKQKFLGIGGELGEMLSGIASIPGIAEIAAVATGMNPAVYAAVKAIQVGGLTGEWDDGLKAGAKAWVMSQGAQMANQAIGNALIDAGMTDISTVNALSNLGSNLASNMAVAAINGNSLSDAGIASLVASLVSQGAQGTVKGLNIPPQYQSVVTQILTDTLLNKDLESSLARLAFKEVGKEVKDVIKTTKKETVEA